MRDPVDYGWVLQVTFVVTVVIGAPLIALTVFFVDLPTWEDRVAYAVAIAAAVWLVTSISVFFLASLGIMSPRGRAER